MRMKMEMSNDDEFKREEVKRLRESFPGDGDLSDDELLEIFEGTLSLALIRLNVRWERVKAEFRKAWSVK